MKNKIHKILLIGPQGSGKGTQAELLAKELNIPAFGMGQLLRDEIAAGSEIGNQVDDIIKSGSLVSDQIAADVLKLRLSQPDTKSGYVLDGYPRNMDQYKAFDFDTPNHVIVIDIPKDESLERLSGRLTCSKCGKVYSTKDGSKVGDKCECSGELIQRADDTPKAIEKRLKIYSDDTEPVIEKYSEKDLVYRIDGVGSVEEVFDRIKSILE